MRRKLRERGWVMLMKPASSADHIQKHMLVWILSVLVVGAAAVFVWWFASDVVVAFITAFEIILWLLGLMLWPFRL